MLLSPVTGITVSLIGFVVVTLDVLLAGPLRAADHQIDRWVTEYVPQSVTTLSRRYFVLPGQRAVGVPPMATCAVMLAWRRRTWRPLLVPLVVMVFLALFVPGIKLWTGRTNSTSGEDNLWSGGTDYPSGHEINAIVIWGMCMAMASELDSRVARWLTRERQTLLTMATAAWVGFAMVIGRTHWFTDVLAGVCIGVAVLWGALRFGFTPRSRQPALRV